MDVLATQFKRNAELREGYMSISEVVENNFKQYIFNSAIKIKPTKESPDRSFTKWIAYWEESPIVIEMTVITTVLETGYVKATIVDKKVRTLEEVGEYPARNSKVFGYLIDSKFKLEKDARAYVMDKVQQLSETQQQQSPAPVSKSEAVDQAAIEQIKKAWGLK